jgi:glycerol-3-phosphate cytidylyltransferase
MENRKVITYGTFDCLHYGHINLLRRAKELGSYLIVGVSSDDFNQLKGKQAIQSLSKRIELLEGIRYIDKIIVEESWEQKRKDIVNLKVEIFTIGDDWEGKFDDLSDICNVHYLSRTEDISSTEIRKILLK